ncbi:Trm112 family protein [Candidatus Woesearchaeota archaeon]|nr:Trm112 family protein [Candidatus Woesearchaeota archaeon]
MKRLLKKILACPACKSPLKAKEDGYCCMSCGTAYPVKEGIPCLMVVKPKSLYNTLLKENKKR